MQLKIIRFLCSALIMFYSSEAFAQQQFHILGTVTDEFSHPLAGATVLLVDAGRGTSTDRRGGFEIHELLPGKYLIKVSFLGYQSHYDTIMLSRNINIDIKLLPEPTVLSELVVTEALVADRKASSSLPVDVVSRDFLIANSSGSLMQTLGRLPGISSMDIGSGNSKPVIRGMGFNRVVVAENGIKHEAQEWGADHGLEIDPFFVDYVELVKGPASLMYGANAIGGVVELKNNGTPAESAVGGSVLSRLQTHNDLFGMAARFYKRFERVVLRANFGFSDYADYQVPTDSISYMTYNIRLKDRRLRNTAGRERTAGVTLGYLHDNFSSHLRLSNHFNKNGFFANAHGLEIRNSFIDYDASHRDIDLPMQQVNHFKAIHNTLLMIRDYRLNIDLGYQHNYRQEFAEAVAHGYMPAPPDSLERLYDKNTFTASVKLSAPRHGLHQLTAGANADFQDNTIGGWGFLMPEFKSATAGVYAIDHMRFSERWSATAGMRYDAGVISTSSWFDWFETPQADGSTIKLQRANALTRNFANLSWGAGVISKEDAFTWKLNVGKSFRMPTAKELASNGINYHMYRFEKGDSTIKAEESYQLDVGVLLQKSNWTMEFTPFFNYFPNFIYLNPSAMYVDAQQMYFYSQSQVFRAGAELMIHYDISKELSVGLDADFIHSVQLSGSKRGYTLPFSPPLSSNIEMIYSPDLGTKFKDSHVGLLLNVVASQYNIVPSEKPTPGYMLLHLKAGTGFSFRNLAMKVNLKMNNVFNTRYYDHTSFYRLIEVPGFGRSFIASLEISI